ncbi:MAG: TIR domain-containing protein [Gammaproteobacteria bacterium]
MAHRTFFSFHYERDVWRSSVVRNSSRMKPSITPEWIEASIWESAKTSGDAAVRKLIDDALLGTSVTAVLIGSQTASRRWVKYEIDQSIERGNGLLGIYVHNIKDKDGFTDSKGANPLPAGYPTYDWVNNGGYNNLGTWVDDAYDAAN